MKRRERLSTFQIIAFSFLALILLGTLLLMLPWSSHEPGCASFADCLFTATSSVCVTGLVVRDTVTSWTPFGQAVLLVLIQIGGLGVVTTAAVISFIAGSKIGLMQRSTMQESLAAPQVGGIVRLTRFIVIGTAGAETLGALLLLQVFVPQYGWSRGIWYSVFHAVSAFCNAGFDLLGAQTPFSSLTGFSQHALANVVVILLITIGGIGFLVWNDIREYKFRFKRYRLQSKLVLLTSACLVLFPFLWFLFFELGDLPLGQRVFPALFQSVTMRTAGFNTVDLNQFSGIGKVLMILLMLVGGSPGSTAGGMKTTTVAMLFLTARAVFLRKDNVETLGRRVSDEAIRNTVAIVVMYFVLFFASGVLICKIEHLPLLTCLFETASAVGTVGVTLGITSELSLLSRGILVVLMFLGRVGGLTLIYAAQQTRRPTQAIMPLDKVTVG